jgi:glycine/D-amino acid oxidase-like deaminating enzyme/nitrite reductase/ring-hydroxylating ferredoxin subunit
MKIMGSKERDMASIWKEDLPCYPFGEEGLLPFKVGVAIIGAGMTGILTALLLKRAGIECAIFEKGGAPGCGQSGNTTGKITAQTGVRYSSLEKEKGEAASATWARACRDAISLYEQLVREYDIDCHFRRTRSVLYTLDRPDILETEAQAARRAGISMHLEKKTSLPFHVKLALAFDNQAQFHPMKFLYAIAKEVRIWFGVTITKVKGHTLYTDEGDEIEAEKVVWATHYPVENFPGMYFTRLYQAYSYGISLHGVPPLGANYYGIDKEGISYLSHGRELLMVGAGHRTGMPHKNPWNLLEEEAHTYFPYAHVTHKWSAQDAMSPDGLPLAGKNSLFSPHRYVATGYSKWGMVGSMISAQIIAGDILGIPYFAAELCSPSRFGSKQMLAVAQEGRYILRGWKNRLFHTPMDTAKPLKLGEGKLLIVGGEKKGVYRDLEGRYHMISPYCSHMGCELAWNPDTLTWDCPCHGSRFSYDGVAIDTPAIYSTEV